MFKSFPENSQSFSKSRLLKMSPCKGRNGALQEFLGKVMGKGKENAYIKGFLVEALINAMPLKEATAVVDRVLPQYAGSWILPG